LPTTVQHKCHALNTYFHPWPHRSNKNKICKQHAGIDFANLIAINNPTVYSLVYNFPTYGRNTSKAALAQFWEGVANISTFTGQAVVATLREGSKSSSIGQCWNTNQCLVPDRRIHPVPQANLIPATYTASAAANLVIS
jgi:hypothetical protein